MMKPIVTDTYDFPTLIGEGYVYVDKTALLRRMISGVDGWKLRSEAKAKRYFLLFMRMAGATVNADVESADGRADAVLETEMSVCVFEFKYGKTAKAALKQISEKGYAKPYSTDDRKVVCVGVNYDPRRASVACEVVNFSDEVVNEVVKSHPGLRKPALIPLIGRSRATVERALASLIAAKRVEFRGAPKTGGYYAMVANHARTRRRRNG